MYNWHVSGQMTHLISILWYCMQMALRETLLALQPKDLAFELALAVDVRQNLKHPQIWGHNFRGYPGLSSMPVAAQNALGIVSGDGDQQISMLLTGLRVGLIGIVRATPTDALPDLMAVDDAAISAAMCDVLALPTTKCIDQPDALTQDYGVVWGGAWVVSKRLEDDGLDAEAVDDHAHGYRLAAHTIIHCAESQASVAIQNGGRH